MRIGLAMAAAALVVGVSAQAASQPPSSAVHSAGSPLSSGPLFSLTRLKGGSPQYASYRLLLQGKFNNAAGKQYDLMGDGTLTATNLEGGTPGYRFRVNLNALAHDSASPRIYFGTLEGQGPLNGPSTPDHFNFNIRGIPNPNGYRLILNGFTQDGILAGDFTVEGGGGIGQGDFAGTK
jgi:hypothetical protein